MPVLIVTKLRMLLNSDELQRYLQYAFDHFSRDLDVPFDFVQASFANSPIPSDFGGNILKLAINILDVWKDRLDGPAIFRELTYIVASCIMLDSARRRTLGTELPSKFPLPSSSTDIFTRPCGECIPGVSGPLRRRFG
jgi:hypothetical protein